MNSITKNIYFCFLYFNFCLLTIYYFRSITLRNEGLSSKDMRKLIFNSGIVLSQDDPYLLKFIRMEKLFPPGPRSKGNYKLLNEIPSLDDVIKDALLGKRNGFFIECGASDGNFISNTIELEMNYGWKGLLIEASPKLFKALKSNDNRKNSWLINACLTGDRPEQIEFKLQKDTAMKMDEMEQGKYVWSDWHDRWKYGVGKINPDYKNGLKYISEGLVDCFSVTSILLAMNVTSVDFFSLDVEGNEFKVLSGIPFSEVDIKVIYVEHNNRPPPHGREALKHLVISKGYKLIQETKTDHLFVKE